MILVNTETIPGKTLHQSLGLVSGSTIRAKNFINDLGAGFKNLIGGELRSYTELLEESRKEATDRMIAQAEGKGANAIVCVRYSTSSIASGAAEIYVYGTAVKI
ncbi:hypothetical protein COB57_06150 [Candidatus Peregrinibacteria bacterium]|nr:MAG: hypothetical protein COB57_06150 [Candidatus Peregrinibacteria bacterium]